MAKVNSHVTTLTGPSLVRITHAARAKGASGTTTTLRLPNVVELAKSVRRGTDLVAVVVTTEDVNG